MMNEREFKLKTSTHEEFVCDQYRMEINGETWTTQYIVLGPLASHWVKKILIGLMPLLLTSP